MKYLFVVALAILLVDVTALFDLGLPVPVRDPVTAEYLGCFRDNPSRVLRSASLDSWGMSVDVCKLFCHDKVIV